jgi:hypothetical protein
MIAKKTKSGCQEDVSSSEDDEIVVFTSGDDVVCVTEDSAVVD